MHTSNRFEVLGADVNMGRSQHEVRLERDSAKSQEETESWCTKVTKKRASRFKDTQFTQTMHLQFLKSGRGEEMVSSVDEGWMRVSSIMDFGAAESVAPPTTCPHVPLTESVGSRVGQDYRTAGGERLRNKGQRHIQVWTDEGCTVGMTYQVADVTKPLNPVSKMCDAGNVDTFTAAGCTVKNLWTGAPIHFRRESGVYVLNTLVKWERMQEWILPGR